MKRFLLFLLIFSAVKVNASSIITDTSFIADCSILSDDSQNISAGDNSSVEISNNNWLISVDEAAEAWAIFATIDFKGKIIDLSKNKYLKVKLSTDGLAIDGVTKIIFRVYQKDSPGKYITFFSQAEGQSYIEEYDISLGWPDMVDNSFDFKKIEKVEIATEVNPGAGTITIEQFELGTHSVSSAIKQTSQSSVIAYPNPVKTYLGLANIDDNANISIFNAQGQVILQQILPPDSRINIGDFRSGIYFIKVENKPLVKFIKE